MNKRIFGIFVILIFFCFPFKVYAESSNVWQEIYDKQLKSSGAGELKEILPKETQKSLEDIGINGVRWEDFSKLDIQKIFEEVSNIGNQKIKSVFSFLPVVLGPLLLCTLIKKIRFSNLKSDLQNTLNCVCNMCVCGSMIFPIIKCVNSAKLVIAIASKFTVAFAGIFSAIMLASGRPLLASSYHFTVFLAGQVMTDFTSNMLVPIINALLGVSIIACISQEKSLSKLCFSFHKLLKILFKFSVGMFAGILTLQSLVVSSVDGLKAAGLKFMIDNFVPVVGKALGDALGTVSGCLKLLKSGIGAFGILAGAMIFLPIICECVMWIFLNWTCELASDFLDVGDVGNMFKSIKEVMCTLLSALLCCATVLMTSSAVIMIVWK